MTVLLLDRLARDVQSFGDSSPRPTVTQRPHDVLCLEVVSENTEGSDGTEAVVGTQAVDHRSIHGATLVANIVRCNLSCVGPSIEAHRPGDVGSRAEAHESQRAIRRSAPTPGWPTKRDPERTDMGGRFQHRTPAGNASRARTARGKLPPASATDRRLRVHLRVPRQRQNAAQRRQAMCDGRAVRLVWFEEGGGATCAELLATVPHWVWHSRSQ